MPDQLPIFPLNTVMFPGVTVPLHVFEDRYRALVHHLLREPDPAKRLFGSVAIRRTRHAVAAGLIADLTGVVASVIICRLMFPNA